ncbi:cupin domain-containing protein [Rhodococcus sovatensis]|uniref:Cupin domain-containing protein n=1 Tax=Rhodococcus sovatensis TaxID=1805840 RepID=A0ABZ2PM53_9NOCA
MNTTHPVRSIRLDSESTWIPRTINGKHLGDNVFLTTVAEDGVKSTAWRHEPDAPLPYELPNAGEHFYILDGEAVITPADGDAITVSAGDMVFVPKGFIGVWETTRALTKFSVTV